MKRHLPSVLAAGIGMVTLTARAQTFDSAANPKEPISLPSDVATLQRALADAQAEISRLRAENERLRRVVPTPSVSETTSNNLPHLPRTIPSTPAIPTPPIAVPLDSNPQLLRLAAENARLQERIARVEAGELPAYIPKTSLNDVPPVQATSIFDPRDLAAYFRQSVAIASTKFLRQKFLIKGIIQRFDTGFGIRSLSVFFETGDRNISIEAQFRIPERYQTIFVRKKDGALVGRPVREPDETILNRGDLVTVEGMCAGFTDTTLLFNSCRLIL